MSPDDIDALEKQVNSLVAKIDKALRHRVTVEAHDGDDGDDGYDEGDGEIDASDPTAEYDGDDNGPDDDDDDGEPVEKRASVFAKLGTPGPGPYAPEATDQQTNSAADRPGALRSSRHKPNYPITETEDFDAAVRRVMLRDHVPHATAMSAARHEAPAAFRRYQSVSVSKSAPDFDQLVAAEMKKHRVTAEVAGQRIMQSYGSAALRAGGSDIRKRAEALEGTFTKAADDLWLDGDLDRCEALRETRKSFPKLFKRMQRA
jgi:hypothetical protein